MLVMLGGVLASQVTVDSAWVDGRPEVAIATDSVQVSIEEFCDAQGRLIRFAGGDLLRVTPNPAGSELVIEYTIAARGRSTLGIYDLGGRVVAGILDRECEPGAASATLDVRQLSEGAYLVVLRSGRFVHVKELRVVR
jgi:hypothetical protein